MMFQIFILNLDYLKTCDNCIKKFHRIINNFNSFHKSLKLEVHKLFIASIVAIEAIKNILASHFKYRFKNKR